MHADGMPPDSGYDRSEVVQQRSCRHVGAVLVEGGCLSLMEVDVDGNETRSISGKSSGEATVRLGRELGFERYEMAASLRPPSAGGSTVGVTDLGKHCETSWHGLSGMGNVDTQLPRQPASQVFMHRTPSPRLLSAPAESRAGVLYPAHPVHYPSPNSTLPPIFMQTPSLSIPLTPSTLLPYLRNPNSNQEIYQHHPILPPKLDVPISLRVQWGPSRRQKGILYGTEIQKDVESEGTEEEGDEYGCRGGVMGVASVVLLASLSRKCYAACAGLREGRDRLMLQACSMSGSNECVAKRD